MTIKGTYLVRDRRHYTGCVAGLCIVLRRHYNCVSMLLQKQRARTNDAPLAMLRNEREEEPDAACTPFGDILDDCGAKRLVVEGESGCM